MWFFCFVLTKLKHTKQNVHQHSDDTIVCETNLTNSRERAVIRVGLLLVGMCKYMYFFVFFLDSNLETLKKKITGKCLSNTQPEDDDWDWVEEKSDD